MKSPNSLIEDMIFQVCTKNVIEKAVEDSKTVKIVTDMVWSLTKLTLLTARPVAGEITKSVREITVKIHENVCQGLSLLSSGSWRYHSLKTNLIEHRSPKRRQIKYLWGKNGRKDTEGSAHNRWNRTVHRDQRSMIKLYLSSAENVSLWWGRGFRGQNYLAS